MFLTECGRYGDNGHPALTPPEWTHCRRPGRPPFQVPHRGQPRHVTQRGIDPRVIFVADADHRHRDDVSSGDDNTNELKGTLRQYPLARHGFGWGTNGDGTWTVFSRPGVELLGTRSGLAAARHQSQLTGAL